MITDVLVDEDNGQLMPFIRTSEALFFRSIFILKF